MKKKITLALLILTFILAITGCDDNNKVTITFNTGRIEEKTQKEFMKEIVEDVSYFNDRYPTAKITFVSKIKSIDTTTTTQLGKNECKKGKMYHITFENDWILAVDIYDLDTSLLFKGNTVKVEANISQYTDTLYVAPYDGDECWFGGTPVKVTRLD